MGKIITELGTSFEAMAELTAPEMYLATFPVTTFTCAAAIHFQHQPAEVLNYYNIEDPADRTGIEEAAFKFKEGFLVPLWQSDQLFRGSICIQEIFDLRHFSIDSCVQRDNATILRVIMANSGIAGNENSTGVIPPPLWIQGSDQQIWDQYKPNEIDVVITNKVILRVCDGNIVSVQSPTTFKELMKTHLNRITVANQKLRNTHQEPEKQDDRYHRRGFSR